MKILSKKHEEVKMWANLSISKKRTIPVLKKTAANLKKVIPLVTAKAWLRKLFPNFTESSGATLIEIALYVALVVIVCIGVITALGDKLQGVFDTIVSSL
jgi:Flp pilus assembly pilin Flp